jgi:hypothetical protein
MKNSLYLVNKKEATRFYLTVLKLVRILVKVIVEKCIIVNKCVMAGGLNPPFFLLNKEQGGSYFYSH